ncbi:MAG: flagellar motor switch protein FliM [Nitrospirae bacterium]|jgi:flagellar motor switch protein FliM|nr:flagellar motor switch protein FliM [Nitrospirota bacterium]
MNDILSQDEVDALLKGVQSGEIDTEVARDKILSGIRAYDFTNQERIIRGRMPGLELANEKFARFFRNSISNLLMKFVDISISSVEITKFGEFMKIIPFPSSINIFKMEPLKGYALFIIEAPLVFAFVEFFFGSSNARHVKSEGRSFTHIEQNVIRKVVNIALKDMASAWSGIAQITPEVVSSEMSPQFVTIVTPSELVIKVEIHIELEDFTGKLFFCIPYSMIEPVKEILYSGIQADKFDVDHNWVAYLKELLKESFVEVKAEIGRVQITLGELVELEVGSVINLGKPSNSEIPVKVEGITKYYGVPGYSRGSQAIKLTKVVKGDNYASKS